MKNSLIQRRLLLACAAAAISLPQFAIAQSAAVSGPLVLYTSQPDKDVKGTIAEFNKKYPDVKVEVFRSGTTEVLNKLRTEISAGAPQPDLILLADSVTMEALKKDGQLMPMKNADVSGIPAQFYDKDKYYIGTKVITTGIVVNTKARFKPASWKELLNPDLKNQVAMPSPLYSGAAAISLGAWLADPALGGWSYVEGLKSNGAIAVRGNGAVLQQVANGEKSAGILVDFMALNAKAKGSPVEFVIPKEGLTFVTEPVAMLKTAKHVAAAEAFVNFLLSADGQVFSTTLGYVPILKGVKPPAGYPAPEQMKFMPLDTGKILEGIEPNKKRFGDIFGG
ncbi:MAG: ABC transporter substrate-binding protein [Rhodoferax sp.]|nr:ABC transporter substrate-binding protein [Rhodoferax sp.]